MKSAFDGLRLVAYLFAGLFGLMMLVRGCNDSYALRAHATKDFLVLTGTYDKRVSRGRFQGYGTETYVRGFVASTGARHEVRLYEACRHIDCKGLNGRGLDAMIARRDSNITYRAPIWSANAGRTISMRAPGSERVNLSESNGDMAGGLMLFSLIGIPLLLWLAFGNGKVV